MTPEDLRQIEGLLQRFGKGLRGEIQGDIREHIGRLDARIEEPSESFERCFGIQGEAFHHDLALMAEGHQMLGEKIDRLAEEMRARADGFERELPAHKADPYAHGARRVSEGEED